MRRKNERNSGETMRDALEACKKLFDGGIMWEQCIRAAHLKVNAALAAPPRNCDVGTPQEQHRRFVELCRKFTDDCEGCPVFEADSITPCEFIWAQMHYEADEAKGGANV